MNLLALEGASVVGIDLAEAGLEVAKLHLLESGLILIINPYQLRN